MTCNSRSNIRFLHNVLGAPNVNIYLDNKELVLNLAYQDFTQYLNVHDGKRKLVIKISGTDTILVSKEIKLSEDGYQTVVILGNVNDLTTIKGKNYKDNLNCPKPNSTNFRFIHGIFGAPNVDVYVNDKIVFANVSYSNNGVPEYASLVVGAPNIPGADPNYFNIRVKVAGTDNTVIGPVKAYMIGGGIYTMVASVNRDSKLSYVLSHDNKNECEVLQKNFDAQRYMGKWYQIAGIPQFFDSQCARSTAEYTLLSDRINVLNTCYDRDWNVVGSIVGGAFSTFECQPAALKVIFPNPPPPAPPLPESAPGPNYLIHKTDYVNYSIVGSPTRTTFFILSRKPRMCKSDYEIFLKYAEKLGYNKSLIKPGYKAVKDNC